MKSEIVNASITSIDCNPFRNTSKYPYVPAKIDALKRSIEAVGVWEGVIVRKKGNRYQLAFGHHRVEAARQIGKTKIPVIVRDLDDEQMLQFMGRENGEDYNADFLVMLETWDAAQKFSAGNPADGHHPLDIARLLGWTAPTVDRGVHREKMNDVASACNAAYLLISAGHLTSSDLRGLTVDAARRIVERAHASIKQVDVVSKAQQLSPRDTNRAKGHVAAAAKAVASRAREGTVALKDLRAEVDMVTFRRANASKTKASPLFAVFADALISQINKMLMNDSAAEKLAQIVDAIPHITMAEDTKALRKIDFALAEHEHETAQWRKKLARKGGKVVPFLQLVKEG